MTPCFFSGFGTVYEAQDILKKKERVAIKRTPHITTQDKKFNFCEVAILQMCNHPNILSFKTAFLVKDEASFLYSQFCHDSDSVG
jgi:serine/threonine protein kinase